MQKPEKLKHLFLCPKWIAYIKPQSCERWKKRSFKQDVNKQENMGYDEATDTYTWNVDKTRRLGTPGQMSKQ